MPRTTRRHIDSRGQLRVVDVGGKKKTARSAVATARVRMSPLALRALAAGRAKKGDVLAAARIAGILAAKRTPELIPACHSIALTRVTVDLELGKHGVDIAATAEAHDRTGVEMEALVAASVAALTLYDMLKGEDRGMVIERVRLESKRGGKSGTWTRSDARGS